MKKIKPSIILHEFAEDDSGFYNDKTPGSKVLPLEDKELNPSKDLAKYFAKREANMLRNIKEQYSEKLVTRVVVGDTHLRSIYTKELGSISPIYL